MQSHLESELEQSGLERCYYAFRQLQCATNKIKRWNINVLILVRMLQAIPPPAPFFPTPSLD